MVITFLDGTKTRVPFYGATKQDCKDQARAAQAAAGRLATSDSPTVEEFLHSWLASKRRTNQIKPRTADGYDDNIRNYIVPGIGRFQLSLLTAWDARAGSIGS